MRRRSSLPGSYEQHPPRSKSMREAYEAIHRIAKSDLGVLIIGEHGTGKDWAARTIHELSPRAHANLFPFDCAATPAEDMERELFGEYNITAHGVSLHRGVIEEAEGGTLLLNEIDVLPASVQLKIARMAEYRQIHRNGEDHSQETNVRLICTLSRDPEPLVASGTIRQEMYYAVSALIVHLPPLRERREDIPDLIDRYLADLRDSRGHEVLGISDEALTLCLAYHWPGNLRNLRNAIEHATIMSSGGSIRPQHLPHYLHPVGTV